MDLYTRSIEVILRHQARSGAYLASPHFPVYAYCWLRDGSFIAHAMDQVGQHHSARAFFLWVDGTLRRHQEKVARLLEALGRGEQPAEGDYLHARYTLQGEEAEGEWWNFQLDGYGTWLWALHEHWRRTQDQALLRELSSSIALTARYLAALWRVPNYDCWEEYPQFLNPYTLAAVYAGLRAAQALADALGADSQMWVKTGLPETLRRFTLKYGVSQGVLVKQFPPPNLAEAPSGAETPMVDASLIAVAVPYGLLPLEDARLRATVARIESDLLCPAGGVHRYLGDSYYGGGEWILLSAWLGWYYTRAGEDAKARALLQWVERQADREGFLPEQVSEHLLVPECYAEWEARWGPVAKPLLWSHAMYLILRQALAKSG
jgi:GH15 family glucan-1,4-alpha-glucosidase